MKKFQFSRLKKRLRKVDKQDDTLYIFSFWVRVGIMMVRKWLPINFNGWGSESSENFSNLLTIKSSVSTLLQLCCLPHHGHWYSYFILITKYPLCINRKRTLTKTKLKQKHFKIGPLVPVPRILQEVMSMHIIYSSIFFANKIMPIGVGWRRWWGQ